MNRSARQAAHPKPNSTAAWMPFEAEVFAELTSVPPKKMRRNPCRNRCQDPLSTKPEDAVVRERILEHGQTPRWPHPDRNPPDLVRGGLQPARARLRPVHPRRDPGADPGHARHASAKPRNSTISPRSTPNATCTTTTSRPSPPAKSNRCAGSPAARSGTARWPNAPWCRSSPHEETSPTPCAWSPKCCPPTAPPRWPPSAARPWR